jgi:hypothetical protein
VKHSVSDKTPREFCGSRIALWSQRTLSLAARSWMRLIAHVSRLEEELVVDKNEVGNCEICVRV